MDDKAKMEPPSEVEGVTDVCVVSTMQPGYAASSPHEMEACTSKNGNGPIGHVADRLHRTPSKSSRGIVGPCGSRHELFAWPCVDTWAELMSTWHWLLALLGGRPCILVACCCALYCCGMWVWSSAPLHQPHTKPP